MWKQLDGNTLQVNPKHNSPAKIGRTLSEYFFLNIFFWSWLTQMESSSDESLSLSSRIICEPALGKTTEDGSVLLTLMTSLLLLLKGNGRERRAEGGSTLELMFKKKETQP